MIELRTLVLAHGSGIDEILGLAIPAVIVGGLWLWSRRRRPEDDEGGGEPGEDPEEGPAVP